MLSTSTYEYLSSILVILECASDNRYAGFLLPAFPTPYPSAHLSVDHFLVFGRNLLEQSSGETLGGYDSDSFNWSTGANNALSANESDEAALEFLFKHAGDVSRAEFHMTTQVSSGAGDHGFVFSDSCPRATISIY